MGFISGPKNFWYNFFVVAIIFVVIGFLFVPINSFGSIPDFLLFLDSKSLLLYFNDHIMFFILLFPLVLLSYFVWSFRK